MDHVIKCGTCGYEAEHIADFHSCIDVLLQKLNMTSEHCAVTEARLAAIHELLGEINELFEKAKEILEGE